MIFNAIKNYCQKLFIFIHFDMVKIKVFKLYLCYI